MTSQTAAQPSSSLRPVPQLRSRCTFKQRGSNSADLCELSRLKSTSARLPAPSHAGAPARARRVALDDGPRPLDGGRRHDAPADDPVAGQDHELRAERRRRRRRRERGRGPRPGERARRHPQEEVQGRAQGASRRLRRHRRGEPQTLCRMGLGRVAAGVRRLRRHGPRRRPVAATMFERFRPGKRRDIVMLGRPTRSSTRAR